MTGVLARAKKAIDFVIDLDRRVAMVAWSSFFGVLVGRRIKRPPFFVHDEGYQVYTAARYAHGDGAAFFPTTAVVDADCITPTVSASTGAHCAIEWTHPPLAKLVLAASIRLFGHNPTAWRMPCVLAGSALVALTYLLGKRMVPARGAAEIAALALALDGMVIVLSRTAMADIFSALTVLIAYFAFYEWLTRRWPAEGDRASAKVLRLRLYLLGLAMGVAIATKWFALLAWGWTGLVVGLDAVRSVAVASERDRRSALAGLVHVVVALVVAPAAIYVASYALFFAHGFGLGDLGTLIGYEIGLNRSLIETHVSASPWWSWPLLLHPVLIMSAETTKGEVLKILLVGNPAFWWSTVPVVGLVALRLRRWKVTPPAERNAQLVIALGFFGQWLPWAVVSRTTFLYYIVPGAPFAALGVGWMMAELAKHKYGRALTIAFVAALIASAMYWWPIWTGAPVGGGVGGRLWLPGWNG